MYTCIILDGCCVGLACVGRDLMGCGVGVKWGFGGLTTYSVCMGSSFARLSVGAAVVQTRGLTDKLAAMIVVSVLGRVIYAVG